MSQSSRPHTESARHLEDQAEKQRKVREALQTSLREIACEKLGIPPSHVHSTDIAPMDGRYEWYVAMVLRPAPDWDRKVVRVQEIELAKRVQERLLFS